MQARTIVVALDVGEQLALGLSMGGEAALVDELDLEGADEALHGGVAYRMPGPSSSSR